MNRSQTSSKVLELDETDRVLELGCGNGLITEYISDTAGAHITGLDISDERTITAGQNGFGPVALETNAAFWDESLLQRRVCALSAEGEGLERARSRVRGGICFEYDIHFQ